MSGRETGTDTKDIQARYYALAEDLRTAESKAQTVEDAFKRLAMVLTSMVQAPDNEKLTQEIAALKQTLKQKAEADRIDASTKALKSAFLQQESESKPKSPSAAATQSSPVPAPLQVPVVAPAPESLEENIRDILVHLIRDTAVFEHPDLDRKARTLVQRVRTEFKLEDYDPFIREVRDLIFQLKDLMRREKKELIRFSKEIIVQLDEAEKHLLKNLGAEESRLKTGEVTFEQELQNEIQEIEQTFDGENLTIDIIRGKVLGKISDIRQRLQRKQIDDQARLSQLTEEKASVERRLESINRRYEEFAHQSKAMLEQMEKFRQASLRDELTTVYNRRAYDLQIQKTVESLKKGDIKQFGLIVFDVDHFKDFNTRYGHRAGDKILSYVARFAKETLRQGDFIFRYGGDEFTIILPESDLKTSSSIAEKIRSQIAEVEFKIFKGSDLTVKIGLSMGVGLGRPDDDPGSVFARADKALYMSKDRGRNRVTIESRG